jgi:hypothetical protein
MQITTFDVVDEYYYLVLICLMETGYYIPVNRLFTSFRKVFEMINFVY